MNIPNEYTCIQEDVNTVCFLTIGFIQVLYWDAQHNIGLHKL